MANGNVYRDTTQIIYPHMGPAERDAFPADPIRNVGLIDSSADPHAKNSI